MTPFPVTALVLAAGRSARLGRNKQLLQLAGEPLVRRAVRTTLAAGLTDVVVVTGFEAPKIEAAVAGLPCRFVHNDQWDQGMGASIAAGTAAARTAVLVVLPDQLLVEPPHLTALLDLAAASPATIVATAYGDTAGAPALFKAVHAAELQSLPPDAGARALLKRHAATLRTIPNADAALDIDTPEQLAALTTRLDLR